MSAYQELQIARDARLTGRPGDLADILKEYVAFVHRPRGELPAGIVSDIALTEYAVAPLREYFTDRVIDAHIGQAARSQTRPTMKKRWRALDALLLQGERRMAAPRLVASPRDGDSPVRFGTP